ncbi:MAG: periplasmic heavy metal sensor, partial [Deltaproteobacteria bacterium]|nr:periplasmic heavy metal sensor [Deltaproteobacteria bacterium]
ATLALGAGPAAACAPGPPDVRRMADKLERNASRLGLSADTLAQIRAIVDAAAPEAEALQSKLRQAHATMRELLDTPRPDEEAVLRQAEAIGALDTALLKQGLRTMMQIRPLLTDAQLAELRKVRAERLAPVLQHCQAIIAAACSGLAGREMMSCLREQPDLPAPCRDAVDALRRK